MDINNYIRKQRLDTYEKIKNLKIIYLDIKYWVLISKQYKETDPQKRLFLDIIIKLYNDKKCIFPISEITFWELFKYHNKTKLEETVKLVDKLSGGISIINLDERRQLEFTHFFNQNLGKKVYNLKELVWSKLGFVLGYGLLQTLSTEREQKNFYNFIREKSLLEIVNRIIESNYKFSFKDNVELLNQNKIKYQNENNSFKQMFLSELKGYIDLYKNDLTKAMHNMYYNEFSRFPTDTDKIDESKLTNLILNAFKYNKITTELPVFRIIPELFASLRWDKERKYKDGNDTLDILHASFALPYCDYFLTENELCNRIIQRKFDSIYKCKVMSNNNEILNVLNKIMQDE